jgi:hypothetical protein
MRFLPKFLRRFDTWLLANHPHLWRTRGHIFLFFTLIAAALLWVLGFTYPQTLYNLVQFNDFTGQMPFYVTGFLVFVGIGVLFWWASAILKFEYRRTNWRKMAAEIGVYWLGLSALWTAIWAFNLGFSNRRAFHLENDLTTAHFYFKITISNQRMCLIFKRISWKILKPILTMAV